MEEHMIFWKKELTEWRETFRDELINEDTGEDENKEGYDEIGRLIQLIDTPELITLSDYQNILYHLWQYNLGYPKGDD